MRKQLLMLVAVLLAAFTTKAQLTDSLKAHYIKDWERSKAYTKEYLDAMPKDKYSFRAQDSVRTFAQQCCTFRKVLLVLLQMAPVHNVFHWGKTWSNVQQHNQLIRCSIL